MLIFEGPDGAGKTTAISQISSKVAHHGPYLDCDGEFLFEIYLNDILNPSIEVCDRSWPSEFIYGHMARNGSRLDGSHHLMLSRVAMGVGAKFVFCLPTFQKIMESYRCRKGEEYIQDEAKMGGLYKMYNHFAALFLSEYDPTSLFNYEIHGIPKMPQPVPRFGIGSKRNNPILIIGERGDLPFVNYHKTGCDSWLTMQLFEAGIHEKHLCWVSAEDNLGNSNYRKIVDLISEIKPKAIISLGNRPQLLVEWFDHPEKHIFQHPHYHMRFRTRTEYPLIPTLKRLIKNVQ